MFLRVVLEVIPQVVGERVFGRGVGAEDARKLRPLGGEFRKLERTPRLEPDEEDALAVLRHDALRVDNLPVNLVAERVGQRVVAVDPVRGSALEVEVCPPCFIDPEGERLRA